MPLTSWREAAKRSRAQLGNGSSKSWGGVRLVAITAPISSGVSVGGRPVRGAWVSPARLWTLNRVAQCRTVSSFSPIRAPISRTLWLSWESQQIRARSRRQADIQPDVPFRTTPHLALTMLERAPDAGVPAAWGVADAVHASDEALRRALEARNHASVLAVRANPSLTTWPPYGPPRQVMIHNLTAAVDPTTWRRRSCGEVAQGPRVCEWAYLPLRPARTDGWMLSLLIRRLPRHPADIDPDAWIAAIPAALRIPDSMVKSMDPIWREGLGIDYAR